MVNYVITAVGKQPREVSQAEMQREYGHLLSPIIMNLEVVNEAVVIKDGHTVTIRKIEDSYEKNIKG